MAAKDRRYYIGDKSRQEWYFSDNGDEIAGTYISLDQLLEKHPGGEYTIVGEVLLGGDIAKKQIKTITVGDDLQLPVNPVGVHSTKSNKCVGFIPCGGDNYIGFYQKSRKAIILPIVFVTALIGALLAGMFYMKQNQPEPLPGGKYEIDSSITDYEGELKRPADMDQTQILIPGFSTLTLKAGSKTVNSMLFNPEDNPCFFQFNVVDKTTGEVLYESKLVPPGKGIETFELNRAYEAGEYPAVIQFKSHDLEDPTINYNGSEMEIKLVVIE